ncbi:unnamed protein product [Trypanosoma congolense IL3000]|uniref:WGS project CAEQ00000000 data, annotated contig 409 n=1 Tax=Trypanosoma congolense (strain IL3000) TaxID=1068625 RepID=F9WFN4_TRYCI|nr:unnamed protein product [Trypanosoma congolense IL3000]
MCRLFLCGYSIASLMFSILTKCWSLTVCIMRSWLHNCLSNWRCCSDMPMSQSFSLSHCRLDLMMSVRGAHADMPRSIVRGICPQDISSHTRMYEFSLRVSLLTSKRFFVSPGFLENQPRMTRVRVLAVGSHFKRIRPYASPSPCSASHGSSRTPLCYLFHLEQSVAAGV